MKPNPLPIKRCNRGEPIITPSQNWWETGVTFNPAAVYLERSQANATELARRYRELGGDAEIVLLKDLGASRATSRGHDGPELYDSARLLKFLLAD